MTVLRQAMLGFSVALLGLAPAFADEFPFGLEVTLEASPLPGARRAPTIEIGENGEAKLDLWCKTGTGQFSVAGDTIIFLPGELKDNSCSPAFAQADDALMANLAGAVNWKRQGDFVSFIGPTTVKFRLNTN